MFVATLEETIVTSAKAGEADVLSMPMAISAVSHDELARLGAQTVDQAVALAPSVTLSQNVGFAQLTIRGIGTNVYYAGSDPSVALYLDGVYLARPGMAFVELLDIDRIEVLRGPQGTLYWTQRRRRRAEPDPETPNGRLPGGGAVQGGQFRSASRRGAGQRSPQAGPGHGQRGARAQRPGRIRPQPRAPGPSAGRR